MDPLTTHRLFWEQGWDQVCVHGGSALTLSSLDELQLQTGHGTGLAIRDHSECELELQAWASHSQGWEAWDSPRLKCISSYREGRQAGCHSGLSETSLLEFSFPPPVRP